jgi:type I restriction enzyme R subunit
LAHTIRDAIQRGEESGLTEQEVAFYDALADNASAREVMQDDTLKLIARELADRIKANALPRRFVRFFVSVVMGFLFLRGQI